MHVCKRAVHASMQARTHARTHTHLQAHPSQVFKGEHFIDKHMRRKHEDHIPKVRWWLCCRAARSA